MKIAVACDHGGFQKKCLIMEHLQSEGHKVTDFGSYMPDSVDYPDYGFVAAESVASGENERAILVCTSGIGMSITANKVHGIRAALCFNIEVARTSRTHNNANVLCLAEKYLDDKTALQIVDVWLKERFRRGRHKRRMDKIASYESLNRAFDKQPSGRTSHSPRSGKAQSLS
ncbi:MAG: ribose 5-phosphate isomerase B, partial [Acidobacteriota bacterium]